MGLQNLTAQELGVKIATIDRDCNISVASLNLVHIQAVGNTVLCNCSLLCGSTTEGHHGQSSLTSICLAGVLGFTSHSKHLWLI